MNEEMRTEAMELCVTACEKFSANNEVGYFYKNRPILVYIFKIHPFFSRLLQN
jgi:hypothetical protein